MVVVNVVTFAVVDSVVVVGPVVVVDCVVVVVGSVVVVDRVVVVVVAGVVVVDLRLIENPNGDITLFVQDVL